MTSFGGCFGSLFFYAQKQAANRLHLLLGVFYVLWYNRKR